MSTTEETYVHKRELRKAVEFFTGFLVAIAFHEAGRYTSDALKKDGLDAQTFILPAVFFLTALRFFIGNQLYLLEQSYHGGFNKTWYYDVVMVTFESVVLIFLGHVVTLEETSRSRIGFARTLVFLCVVDVLWHVSKFAVGNASAKWGHCKPRKITWWWVGLNAGLVLGIVLGDRAFGGIYTTKGLIWLGLVNAAAFVIDVVITDLTPRDEAGPAPKVVTEGA